MQAQNSPKKLSFGKDGVLTYDRTHRKKPWADLFEQESDARLHGHSNLSMNQFQIERAMQLLSSKFAKIVRERLRAKHLQSNRRNVSDVVKPAPIRSWVQTLGSQAFCDLCRKPSVNRCVFCITCGCIAHRLCVLKSSTQSLMVKPKAPGTLYYECRHCCDTMNDEQKFYDDTVAKIKRVNARVATQQVIDEHIIAKRVQAHAKRVKESVILIQSAVRKYRARTVFFMWRRTQLRVVVLEINDIFPLICPQGDPSYHHLAAVPPGFVVATVVDPIKHLQVMRVEKKLQLALKEGFLLPGISALMQVVLTFFIREPNQAFSFTKQTNIMIGQVIVALRDTHDFLLPHTYTLAVSKKVTWLPQPITTEKMNIEINTLWSNSHDSNVGYVLCTNTTPNHNSFTPWVVGEHTENLLDDAVAHTDSASKPASALVAGMRALNFSGQGSRRPSRTAPALTPTHSLSPIPTARVMTRPKSAHPTSDRTASKIVPNQYQTPEKGVGNVIRPVSAVARGSQSRPSTAGASRNNSRPTSGVSRPSSAWGEDTKTSKLPNVSGKFQSSSKLKSMTPGSPKGDANRFKETTSTSQYHALAHKKLDVKQFLESVYHTCTLRYIPLNPISNICAKVLGPPIDALRKVPLVSFRKSNTKTGEKQMYMSQQSNTGKRSTHYWLVLADLWLYFFLSHNDGNARLMGDIKDAEVFLERTSRGDVLQILHADSRNWQFEFEDDAKAVKFNFAINEAQRALKTGESIFMKPPRSGDNRPFGHTGIHVR